MVAASSVSSRATTPATSSEVFQRPRGIVASSGRSLSQPGRARQAPQFYATGLTNAIDLAFGPGGTRTYWRSHTTHSLGQR
jgi:hypothetical protein